MNIKQILIKNTSVQMVTHVTNLAIGLLLTMILSRYLGVEGFGELNYVFAFYFFFLALSDFGVNTIVIRECSKEQEKAPELIGAMLSFKMVIALLSVAIAWSVIEVLDFTPELKVTLRIYSLILPMLALQLPGVIFRVALKMEYPSVLGLTKSVLNILVVLGALIQGFGLKMILGGYVATELVLSLAIWFFAKKLVKLKLRFDLSTWVRILKSSIPLGITGIFVALISRADFIMLERMVNVEEVGLYSAAYRITSLAESLPMMMMATFYPLMSRFATEDEPRLTRLFYKSTGLLTCLGIALGVVVTICAPWIIRILFGDDFRETIQGLQILIWATVFLYAAISGGNLLISVGREKLTLSINAIAAILNIALNLVLIPKMGFRGAALATSMTYAFILLATLLGVFYAFEKMRALPDNPNEKEFSS